MPEASYKTVSTPCSGASQEGGSRHLCVGWGRVLPQGTRVLRTGEHRTGSRADIRRAGRDRRETVTAQDTGAGKTWEAAENGSKCELGAQQRSGGFS